MTQEPLVQRIANLEMLLIHMQRDAEEMNKALVQQGKQVDQLQRMVQQLAQAYRGALAEPSAGNSETDDI